MGGQQVGSVWGHGAYVAPDWSADWLHREAIWLLEHWAQADHGKAFGSLTEEQQASLKARLKHELRVNTYDPKTGDLVVSPLRAEAIRSVASHYTAIFFGDDPATEKLRDAYAIPANAIRDPVRMGQLNDFFFWASWVCSTNRPGGEITYTNNWPSEKLIDNRPSGADPRLVVDQLRGPAGGHRHIELVVRRSTRQTGHQPRAAGRGPAAVIAADAINAGDVEILLGRHGADHRPDRAGCSDGALRGRGLGFLRHPAGQVAPLRCDPHLAYPARYLLDRHRLAGDRVVHGPGGLGTRAEIPATGRQFPVRMLAGHRRRLDGGPVVCRPAEARERDQLLVRPPGLRVRGSGAVLAALPDGRAVPVAVADGPGDVARLPFGREPQPAGAVLAGLGRHPDVLRPGAVLAPAVQPGDRRILALVGGPSVGRGLLRGLRHRGDRLPVHPDGTADARPRPRPQSCSRRPSS